MKRLITVFLTFCCIFALTGCATKGVESDYPAALIFEGEVYYLSTEEVSLEADRVIGRVDSYTDAFPEKDNQSNFGKGQELQIAEAENGIAVWYHGAWHLCRPKQAPKTKEDAASSDALPQVLTKPDHTVAWVNWSDDPKIKTAALNADTFALSSKRHLPIYKCDDLEQLNGFQAAFDGIFTWDSGWDEIPSFTAAAAGFTEDFFEQYTLLLVYVEDGSCTPRYGVENVTVEGDTLTVTVKLTYAPEVGDCAMAGWMIAIPVQKTAIAECSSFDAILG